MGVVKDLFSFSDPTSDEDEHYDVVNSRHKKELNEESNRKCSKKRRRTKMSRDYERSEKQSRLKCERQHDETNEWDINVRGVTGQQVEGKGEDQKKSHHCSEGFPLLNECDESTITPGLFLVGPAVRHENLSFCFVYKFRQRFGIVAEAIAKGLGYTTDISVGEAREMNMFLDDFSCCQAACGESC